MEGRWRCREEGRNRTPTTPDRYGRRVRATEQTGGALRRLALYAGGFMGPFGTVLVIPMFPELREEFDTSSSAAGLTFSLYLLPFALTLLVSGTLGERWGRRRTVRGTYLLYAAASLACAVAPGLGWLIAGRALQGVANAFITPLLLAGLAEMVAPERFGREAGRYSSFQALGGGLGPVLGGVAADTNWRLAFVGAAAVALLLASSPPDGEPRPQSSAPRLRPLLHRRLVLLGIGFFLAAAGPLGVAVLVGVAARDELELSGSAAGLILLAGAMSALALGPAWGRLIDTFGIRRATLGMTTAATLAAAALALTTSGATLAIGWAIGGGLIASIAVAYQATGATIEPENRGGALSFLLAFRFTGHAAGPIAFVPLFDWSYAGTFLVAAAPGLITLAILAAVGPR